MSPRLLLRPLVWPMATGILLSGFSSCGNKQQEARSELSAKAFTFTVDEFMRAAREGNVTALQHFMEAGMVVDAPDAEGVTALFRAAQAGQSEAVKFLAARGANVETPGTGFDTPLVAAARTGTLETVKALLDAKAMPEVRTSRNSWTALTAAAYRGDVGIVNLLAPVSSGSIDEALQISSLQGQPAVVDALLRQGADVFSRSKDNKTPLMYAAAHGHADVVRLLMLSGSNKLLMDNDKQTAADLALAGGYEKVVAVLDDPSIGSTVASSAEPPFADGPAVDGAAAESTPAPPASVPGDMPTSPEVTVADAGAVMPAGPSEHGLAGPAGAAPAVVPSAGESEPVSQALQSPVAGGSAEDDPLARGMVATTKAVAHPRLGGAQLPGLADGSTASLKQSVRVRDFREGHLPIVLEEVPASSDSARIRVIGRGGEAPEIVPPGGVIGDTGLELVGVERKFMNSKMGAGRLLDVSQVVVRDRATGRRHVVRKDQSATSSEPTAFISAGVGGDTYEVKEGDEFTAGEQDPERYRVLDVRPTQVVVENLKTRETATLARTYAQ